MEQEIQDDEALARRKLQRAESAKKHALLVGWICLPLGVVVSLACFAYSWWAWWEYRDATPYLLGVACFFGLVTLVGLSSFIAALIFKLGFRKAMGWIILGNVAWLAVGCVIFFTTQLYTWGETLGADIAFICVFVFIAIGPFAGWILSHPRHGKSPKGE